MLLNVFNVFLKGDVSTCFQSLKGWVKSTNLCRRSVEAVVSRSVDLLCRRSVEAVETPKRMVAMLEPSNDVRTTGVGPSGPLRGASRADGSVARRLEG